MSVWQLATTVAAILVLPIRHSSGFTFVAGRAIHLYIDQWFTPLYAIAYAIMNGTENLRFDKEDYFHVLVFYTSYFVKEIENVFPRVPIVIETLVEVWENSKLR